MKVFLSWSKPRSQKVAELLNNWIPCIIQAVEPWFSTQNIEDGELWFSAIQTKVSEIINGIVCLTQENKQEPWVLFEAGGLAKGLEKSRIYILLIDLTGDDILLSPLSAFNHTKPTEEGIRKLMHVINGRTAKPIPPQVLDQVFNKFWPDFEQKFKEIITETEAKALTTLKKVNKEEINSEILIGLLKSVRGLETSINNLKDDNINRNNVGIETYRPPLNSYLKYIKEFRRLYGVPIPELASCIDQIKQFISEKRPETPINMERLHRVINNYINEYQSL